MSKGRILIVTYALPPAEGGVGMAAFEMANSLHSLGWDIHILTRPLELPASTSCSFPYSVTRVPDSLIKSRPRFTEYLNTLPKEERPGCIIYHSWSHWIRKELMEYARENDIPFILRSHGVASNFLSYFNLHYFPFFGMKKWLCSFFQIRRNVLQVHKESPLNHLVCLDPYGTVFKSFDYYCSSRLNLSHVTCIPNTFPALTQEQPCFRKKYGLQDQLVFTYPASASNRKQQLLFIQHVKRAGIQNILFLFLIPQRNAYAEQMEQDIGEDPRFRILYNIPRQEITSAIIESDAIFLYSYQEQQPLCILEAMSCQVPWIAPDVGAISQLEGGIILKRRSPAALKKALLAMQDINVRTQLGKKGLQHWQKHYAPDIVYRQWEELLSSTASSVTKEKSSFQNPNVRNCLSAE